MITLVIILQHFPNALCHNKGVEQQKGETKMKTKQIIAITILAITLSACGNVRSTGGITVKSQGLSVVSSMEALNPLAGFNPDFSTSAVGDFKFCITQMKVVTGTAGDPTEAILGLIDLSSSAATDWGNIDIADGTSVAELDFELHTDPENCSAADYSMSYKNTQLTKDLEFKFVFSPAVTVATGDSLLLNLDAITTALESAYNNSSFTNELIGNYLETTTEGSGSRE